MTARDDVPERNRSRHADGVRTLRAGVLRAALGPVVAAIYVLGTLGEPNRLAMAAVIASTLLMFAGLWIGAAAILRTRLNFAIQAAGSVLAVVAMATVLLLDGGVASPVGAAVVFALIFFATTVPWRMFIVVCAGGAVAYAAVAVIGDAGPPGYAPIMMLLTVGIGYLCRRYASLLYTMKRRLTDLSTIDALTGCLNRRGFDQRLASDLARAERGDGRLAVVRIDLDRFKDVNDSLGHAAGDDLLAWVGTTLSDTVRSRDAVGRIGGDEFAVILADTSRDAAEAIVERLRRAVGELAPASYGFAAFPADGRSPDELQQRADERLYADKATAGEAAVPSADRIGAVGARADVSTDDIRDGKVERVRRTVIDFGLLCSFCHASGLLYTALLAAGRPNRLAIAAALCVGFASGMLEAGLAGRLSRSRWRGAVMMLIAVPMFGSAAVAVVLDGGVLSPLSLGLIAPLPMVAYGTPIRKTAPIVIGVVAVYVGIGVVCGGVSPWYVALYIVGALTMTAECARMGAQAAEQRRRLAALSRTDVMTGCLNRRGFEERFEAERTDAMHRPATSLSLVLLDLNGFKLVNDTLGHLAGDELLVWVATTLREALADRAIVGRLGGDEFAVLIADPATPAATVAEELRSLLAARTAVSLGVAALGADGDDFDDLYTAADHRLYEEKRALAGDASRVRRSRVVVSMSASATAPSLAGRPD